MRKTTRTLLSGGIGAIAACTIFSIAVSPFTHELGFSTYENLTEFKLDSVQHEEYSQLDSLYLDSLYYDSFKNQHDTSFKGVFSINKDYSIPAFGPSPRYRPISSSRQGAPTVPRAHSWENSTQMQASPHSRPIARPHYDRPRKDDRKPVPNKGILAYSYFRAMDYDKAKSVYATASITEDLSFVTQTVSQKIKAAASITATDTDSVSALTLNVYKFLKIELKSPGDDFTIENVHDSARQEIDADGNYWEWTIRPKTTREVGYLIYKVVAETPDGKKNKFESRTIEIAITIRNNFPRQIWIFLHDHPADAIKILTACIGGVLGLNFIPFFKRGKKENQPATNAPTTINAPATNHKLRKKRRTR